MKNTTLTAFGDCLKQGNYKIHSCFEHIDNFTNQGGEFISLAADISYLAPNSIIINDFVSGKYAEIIVEKDFVSFIDNKTLLLATHTPFIPLKGKPNPQSCSNDNRRLSLSKSKELGEIKKYSLYKELQQSSSFKYPNITYSEAEHKIQNFISHYAPDFPSKSLFFLLHPENKKHFTSAFEKAFVQQIEFAYSLFPTTMSESIKAFKSRGCGLTPSGDDFVAGVLFGFDFIEKTSGINFNEIKNSIYEISKSNNIFSYNMLRMAYHAKYFKRLQDFLNAFFYLPLNDVCPAFKQLIAVGDTSGADLLTGFFTVILFYRRETQRRRKETLRILK